MLNELAMVYQVIRRPNSAFAALRDDDRRYFLPSIVVMLLTSVVYYGIISASPEPADKQAVDVVAGIGVTILGTVAYVGITYLIGRALGGNKNWRKVLTVLFYANIIYIPATIIYFVQYAPGSFLFLSFVWWAGYITAIVFVIWLVVVHVKAIKVLNGFGTAKAFGILILPWVIQLSLVIPINLLYPATLPIELPVTQMLLQ